MTEPLMDFEKEILKMCELVPVRIFKGKHDTFLAYSPRDPKVSPKNPDPNCFRSYMFTRASAERLKDFLSARSLSVIITVDKLVGFTKEHDLEKSRACILALSVMGVSKEGMVLLLYFSAMCLPVEDFKWLNDTVFKSVEELNLKVKKLRRMDELRANAANN